MLEVRFKYITFVNYRIFEFYLFFPSKNFKEFNTMNGICTVIAFVNNKIPKLVNHGARAVGYLAGRVVKWVENIPEKMHHHRNIAIAVFVVCNILFFKLANMCAHVIEDRIDRDPAELDDDANMVKNIFVNGIFMGLSVLAFNVFLCQITRCSLGKSSLAAISVGAIAIRLISHCEEMDDVYANKDEGQETKTPTEKEDHVVENLTKKDPDLLEPPKEKEVDPMVAKKSN